jgi:Nuclease-related domain
MFLKKKKRPRIEVQRRAGQSLAERWQELVDDHLFLIVFGPFFLWVMVVVEWMQRALKKPLPLGFWLSAAVVATGASAIAFLRLVPKARALARGERGEILVAEQLESLRAVGFRCFHDFVQDGFNIDHVVVGPPGVFVIETKYRSGSGLIEFRNGQGIFVGGQEEERDPLKQARGNARAVHDLIRQDAGVEIWVKPLVVFVGDWKVKNAWRDTDVRVLTARHVSSYFRRQDQPALTKRDIELICSHLKRTVRS